MGSSAAGLQQIRMQVSRYLLSMMRQTLIKYMIPLK